MNSDKSPNVLDLASFRAKKQTQDDLANGRQPLYTSHIDGKLSGSPHLNRPQTEDFGDRLTRIKGSLEKINRLMAELKKVASQDKSEAKDQPINILSKK